MVITLIVLAVVLGIAFFQVIQGLFSALIMTILTIISAAIAFNFYESLASVLYDSQPAYADGAALIALFVLLLLGFRLLYDRFIGANMMLGVWVDRIGGGALGLITGMLLVGTLMIAAQMLPFGETVLGYRPFDDSLQRDQSLSPFAPDRFTLGVMEGLSGGSLKADRPFDTVHDNLLLEAFCARNTAGRGGRIDAPRDSLKIVGVYEPPSGNPYTSWMDELPADAVLGRGTTTKVVVIRAAVSESARGEDGWWRLPATHFRLVTKAGRSCYPVGYLLHRAGRWEPVIPPRQDNAPQYAKLSVEREHHSGLGQLNIDWAYRIPLDEEPDYLVFRRLAKADIKAVAKSNPLSAGALKEVKVTRRQPRRRRGRRNR